MMVEHFEKIAATLLPFSGDVLLIGGEPLMHPGFYRISQQVHAFKNNLKMTTNLSFLEGDRFEAIKNFFNGIVVSIDAATKETYEKIRTGLSFDRVKQNLGKVAKLKSEKGLAISIAAVVMRQNIHELPLLVEMAADYNLDGVDVSFVQVRHRLEKEDSLLYHRPLANKYFDMARKQAQLKNVRLNLPPDFDLNREPKEADEEMTNDFKKCPRPWDRLRILTDGTVVPCCILYEENMGNIFENRFGKVWNGQTYKKLRKYLRKGNPAMPLACRTCRLIGKKASNSNNPRLHFSSSYDE